MLDLTAPEAITRPFGRAWRLAGLYAGLAAANYACAETGFRPGEWVTKPLLMPTLGAFLLAASKERRALTVPVAGMLLGGLGDTALLATGNWFLVGMGCFGAGHACYIAAFTSDGAARRLRPVVIGGYAAAWAALVATALPGLGSYRVPVVAYSALLFSMAVLASGRNRAAALGGALFVVSDSLIAFRLADITAFAHQDAAVMPTYVAAQFLLALGWLRPQGQLWPRRGGVTPTDLAGSHRPGSCR